MVEQKIERLLLENSKVLQKSKIVFYKGNPKYWIPGVSEKFYSDIINIVKRNGFNLQMEESEPGTPIYPADAYIVFSRGAGRAKWIPKSKPIAFLGSEKEYQIRRGPFDISLKTLGDLTEMNIPSSHSKESLIKHWTLTTENSKRLDKWLKKIHSARL